MISKLKIEGVQKLIANNAELAKDLARESRKVIIDEADKMVIGMKQKAPVKTGALRDSLQKRIWKDKEGITGAVVGIKDQSSFRKGRYYYPASQEYGWTVGRTHYPGKPYMRPTFDARKSIVKARLRNVIKAIVDRVRPK